MLKDSGFVLFLRRKHLRSDISPDFVWYCLHRMFFLKSFLFCFSVLLFFLSFFFYTFFRCSSVAGSASWSMAPLSDNSLKKKLTMIKKKGKVEKILKGSLDLIQSPSASVKIQKMGCKFCSG